MKPMSPLKVYKTLRGWTFTIRFGLPEVWALCIAKRYMKSKYWQNYTKKKAAEWETEKARLFNDSKVGVICHLEKSEA